MNICRVAFISADGFAGRGGIGRMAAYLRAAMPPDIVLLQCRSRLSGAPVLKHLTVPVSLAAFAWGCALGRFDIVHINIAPRGSTWRKMLFAWVARCARLPIVLHLHGSGYDAFFRGQSKARQTRIRAFFAMAQKVVALSEGWARFVEHELDVAPVRVQVIANGVGIPPFVAAGVGAGRGPGSPLTIQFLGEIGPRKGVDLLIEALASLPDDAPPWRANLAGNGDIDWARTMAVQRGIADRIDFPGWVDAPAAAALLSGADLFVLPSRAENQPVAVLEAAAHGVAVIASDVGALPEQVIDHETGRVVAAGDAKALASAMAQLLASPERRLAMGRAGRERVIRHYSLTACAQSFAALYRSLVSHDG